MLPVFPIRSIAFSAITLGCVCTFRAVAQTPPLEQSNLRASVATEAPNLHPARPVSYELRGDIYMARKMYDEAILMYSAAPQSSPVIANKLGIANHQLMKFDLAKANYQRALKLDSKYSEAVNNLGTVYYAEKNYRKAIACYKKALAGNDGKSASVFANLGAGYFARKQYKRASEAYERALQLDPEVFEHRGGYGTLMQERTVTELALFHLSLAKTYAKKGVNDRAMIYLRKALEEGVKDRQKIPDIPEFAELKKSPEFVELLAANPKPL